MWKLPCRIHRTLPQGAGTVVYLTRGRAYRRRSRGGHQTAGETGLVLSLLVRGEGNAWTSSRQADCKTGRSSHHHLRHPRTRRQGRRASERRTNKAPGGDDDDASAVKIAMLYSFEGAVLHLTQQAPLACPGAVISQGPPGPPAGDCEQGKSYAQRAVLAADPRAWHSAGAAQPARPAAPRQVREAACREPGVAGARLPCCGSLLHWGRLWLLAATRACTAHLAYCPGPPLVGWLAGRV